MSATDRLALLEEFYREKVALHRRHQASAEHVSAYDSNNAYQYILAREDAHLEWLRRALAEAGGSPDEVAPPAPPDGGPQDDARVAAEFVARWQPRVAALKHARDRKMLELVLGEVTEHQRFFTQAAAGSPDLLGRRPEGVGTGGGVLSRRWVE